MHGFDECRVSKVLQSEHSKMLYRLSLRVWLIIQFNLLKSCLPTYNVQYCHPTLHECWLGQCKMVNVNVSIKKLIFHLVIWIINISLIILSKQFSQRSVSSAVEHSCIASSLLTVAPRPIFDAPSSTSTISETSEVPASGFRVCETLKYRPIVCHDAYY